MTAQRWMVRLVLQTACVIGSARADLVLVDEGESRAPIIVAADATPDTKRAAAELAGYIEEISGARTPVIEGLPDPVPAHVIWVGYQPAVGALFPEVELNFKHPGEILIAANDRHVVIAGRDRLVDGKQLEFGTANAVYTFLRDRLGVRWLWPGPLGEDVVRRKTIALAPFERRYHPQMRMRRLRGITTLRGRTPIWTETTDWARRQRVLLTSMSYYPKTSFTYWGVRYHETRPEFLALQPDGSRTPPDLKAAKVCMSNPAVWEQWLDDVDQALREDPTRTMFGGAPSDGHSRGICVCKNCRAWDAQDAPLWGKYSWRGLSQEYVPMSDRYATFMNHLARGLKGRFPDRELYVYDIAYGPNTPPPIKTVLEDNTIVGYVGYFPLGDEESRRQQKTQFAGWAAKAPALLYRPNCWYFAGGVWGLPEVAMAHTIEDFRFLAENHCVGLDVDVVRRHWATQGPQYYLMAQLAWDPLQDGEALLADYYRRGFGPAAGEIEEYWTMMEEAREAVNAHPKHAQGSRYRLAIFGVLCEVLSSELLSRADATLRRAEVAVAAAPERYRQRVAFVRAGFEFTRKMFEAASLMTRVRATKGADAAAATAVDRLWGESEALAKQFPHAISFGGVRGVMRPGAYMGNMQDYFGPPSKAFRQAAEQGNPVAPPAKQTALTRRSVAPAAAASRSLKSAAEADWRLAFHDRFDRAELGAHWTVIRGKWSIEKGALVTSGGVLACARGFPGFQRVEFEATTDVKPVVLFDDPARQSAVGVSDLSAFIQAKPVNEPLQTGYFFQFGGMNNTCTGLRRAGVELWKSQDPTQMIVPKKTHRIIVENDEGCLRFIADGKLLHEERETASLVGKGQDRLGLYLYTAARVRDVKIYVKPLDDGKI